MSEDIGRPRPWLRRARGRAASSSRSAIVIPGFEQDALEQVSHREARQVATIFASIARRRPPRPASGSAGASPGSEAL